MESRSESTSIILSAMQLANTIEEKPRKELTPLQEVILKELEDASKKGNRVTIKNLPVDRENRYSMHQALNVTIKKNQNLHSKIESCRVNEVKRINSEIAKSYALELTFKEAITESNFKYFLTELKNIWSTPQQKNKYENANEILLANAEPNKNEITVKVDQTSLPHNATCFGFCECVKKWIKNKTKEKITLRQDEIDENLLRFKFNKRQVINQKEWIDFVNSITATREYDYRAYLGAAELKGDCAYISIDEGEDIQNFWHAFRKLVSPHWKKEISIYPKNGRTLGITFTHVEELPDDIWVIFRDDFLATFKQPNIGKKRKEQSPTYNEYINYIKEKRKRELKKPPAETDDEIDNEEELERVPKSSRKIR